MRRLVTALVIAFSLTLPALAHAAEPDVKTPMELFGPASDFDSSLCGPFQPGPDDDPPAPGSENYAFTNFGPVPGSANTDLVTGHFARPYNPIGVLVVFFHGYSHLSDSWESHLKEAAGRGMHAVALDYRGHRNEDGFDRGWEVFNAAEEGNYVAKLISETCGIPTVIAFGVSMGGNSSGLAVATNGTRTFNGTERPNFDYWFDVEGVTNIVEESTAARAAAPSSVFVANADADIAAAYGGRIEDAPARYLEGTVVLRASDMKARGLKGAFIIHGVDDGLAPYNQALEMNAALLANQIPTENYTVVTRGTSEAGTTATGTVLDPVLGPAGLGYESTFAGHASEASRTHRVMRTALDRLYTFATGTVGHLGTSLVPLV